MNESTDIFDTSVDLLVSELSRIDTFLYVFNMAIDRNQPLQVTVKGLFHDDYINSSLTFEAHAFKTDIIDGIYVFYFRDCSINGQLKAASTYYNYNDILDLYLPSSPNSTRSFEILHDSNTRR